jgi:hypothetical protein
VVILRDFGWSSISKIGWSSVVILEFAWSNFYALVLIGGHKLVKLIMNRGPQMRWSSAGQTRLDYNKRWSRIGQIFPVPKGVVTQWSKNSCPKRGGQIGGQIRMTSNLKWSQGWSDL